MTIFVRHGQPRVDPDVDSSEWSLDADALVAVAKLAALLPTGLPILASDERKARETRDGHRHRDRGSALG